MLTIDQKRRILAALSVTQFEGDEEGENWYRRLKDEIVDCTPFELHLIAGDWHWEFGWRPLYAIIEHPRCDAATALQIFWEGSPESYMDDWMLSCNSEEYDVEHRDLLVEIQKSIRVEDFSRRASDSIRLGISSDVSTATFFPVCEKEWMGLTLR